jgi:FdhD protein
MPNQPQSRKQVARWRAGAMGFAQDFVTGERPIQFILEETDRSLGILMRTPGDDFDLATGFLYCEGYITSPDEIVSVRGCRNKNQSVDTTDVLRIQLKPAAHERALAAASRMTIVGSACGICGTSALQKSEAKILPAPQNKIAPSHWPVIAEVLRDNQTIFAKTGSTHAAALFSSKGHLIQIKEDIGRHNAMDKLIGWMLHQQIPSLTDYILLTSGRASMEIVQKAILIGCPSLGAISAPSDLAVEIARRHHLTLVGLIRDEGFNIYSGDHHVE